MKGFQVAGKLDHLSQVKANEHQSSSVSGWKLEGRAADWLSLGGGDQGTVIDSPIGVSSVKVVPPNKTGCHWAKKGEHILGRQTKIDASPLNWGGSWTPRPPKKD